jgi:hypothetical protein
LREGKEIPEKRSGPCLGPSEVVIDDSITIEEVTLLESLFLSELSKILADTEKS